MKQHGVITRIMPNKGFGFIRGDDGISRFMHASDVDPKLTFDTMREGQTVEFISVKIDNGKGNELRAKEVRLVQEQTRADAADHRS